MIRRALVVAASPEGPTPSELAALAEQHDDVVAVDGGAAALLRAGVTPDVVVGDMDSLSRADRDLLVAREVPFDIHPCDKDETDLELALKWCRRRGVGSVTLTHVWGGGTDHALAALGSMLRAADLTPMALCATEVMTLCTGRHRPVLRGFTPGDTISVLPLSETAVVTLVGMRWPLNDHRLGRLSSRGVSNIVTATDAEVRVADGEVLVVQKRDDGRSGWGATVVSNVVEAKR